MPEKLAPAEDPASVRLHETARPVPLETIVGTTAMHEGRALDENVYAIEIPPLFLDGEQRLLDASKVAQQMSESGSTVEAGDILYVTQDGFIAIEPDASQKPLLGTEYSLEVTYAIRHLAPDQKTGIPRALTQDRFVAAVRHTHPYDAPTSAIDLATILREDGEPGANMFTYVVTDKATTLIFRTADTPQLSNEDATRRMERMHKIDRQLMVALIEQGNIEEASQIPYRMLELLVHHYKLRMFQCPRGETVAQYIQPRVRTIP